MTDNHRSDRLAYAGPAFTAQPQHDRNAIDRARQAAEALFATKPRNIEPSPPAAAASADQTARRPRILSAVRAPPNRDEPTKTPVIPASEKSSQKIPGSHLGRIRTFIKYGMTASQVAEVYGVGAGDIERMLHKT